MGKTRIHMAAAENDLPPAQAAAEKDAPDHQWLASFGFVWEKNLISIVLISNDLPFLNEMLHGDLALGKQAAAPLFSAGIGQGKPIQLKR